jgi:hypothetical protein
MIGFILEKAIFMRFCGVFGKLQKCVWKGLRLNFQWTLEAMRAGISFLKCSSGYLIPVHSAGGAKAQTKPSNVSSVQEGLRKVNSSKSRRTTGRISV